MAKRLQEDEMAGPAKSIRFSELVKKCGQPETLTLWSKPENNPELQRAIRQNRVLTVIQKPAGSHKDFGFIGFHKEAFALYLIFPRRLPKAKDDALVIGIHYNLIASASSDGEPARVREPGQKAGQKKPLKTAPKAAQKIRPVAKPKPVIKPAVAEDTETKEEKAGPVKVAAPPPLKTFKITILRTGTLKEAIEIEALNIAEAESAALEQVKHKRFAPKEIHSEVESVEKMNRTFEKR